MEEDKCCSHDRSWMQCSLCRSGRLGVSTLHRARRRTVAWLAPLPASRPCVEEPEVSLDDALSAMMRYMQVSTRKCRGYHHHVPHPPGSSDQSHHLRYHTHCCTPVAHGNAVLAKSCELDVQASPGTYAVTAVRWGRDGRRKNSQMVQLAQGKTVCLTFDL